MQVTLIVTLVLHVLSGVFWAGSTFTLARTGGAGADKLFRPQMGAAVVAVLTGAALWHLVHAGRPGPTEYVLAAGALSAVAAAGVQGLWGGRALRMLASAGDTDRSGLETHIAKAQGVAGGLLALTVISMAAARYA